MIKYSMFSSTIITLIHLNYKATYFFFLIIIFFGAYYLLHQNLNVYYEDDSWTTSVVYNIFVNDTHCDDIFLDDSAITRQQLFGILFANISGFFLNIFGWTKSNVFLLSSFFILLSSWVWHYIAKSLPLSNITQKYLAFLLPIFPPIFFAAHTGRPDAFTFLLMSIGILSFVKNFKVLAGILLALAMENHLIGVVTGFYYLGYFIYQWERSGYDKDLLLNTTKFTSTGLLLGLSVYAVLHYNTFSFEALFGLVKTKADMVSPVNNYILAYFTDFDWYSHIPEFILLLVTVFLYVKNKIYKKNRFLQILLLTLLISTLITRRENRNYFLFLSPVILMFYLETFYYLNKPKIILNGLLLVGLFYYSNMYFQHKSFHFDDFVHTIRTATTDDLPIVGMPDVWFAAYDKEFVPIHNERNFNTVDLDSFYLVETDYLKDRSRSYTLVKGNIYKNYNCVNLNTWQVYNDNYASICKCKDDALPKIPIVYRDYPGWKSVVETYLKASL